MCYTRATTFCIRRTCSFSTYTGRTQAHSRGWHKAIDKHQVHLRLASCQVGLLCFNSLTNQRPSNDD